jgi:hypothetical protein
MEKAIDGAGSGLLVCILAVTNICHSNMEDPLKCKFMVHQPIMR